MRKLNEVTKAMEAGYPRMLTPNEVAATGIMSLYSIRKGIANGTVPFVKIGSHYRVNYDKLLQMLENC